LLKQVLTNSLEVTALAFSPDGARLVAGCWNGFMQEWDLTRSKLLRQAAPHRSHIWELAYAEDGTLFTASNDHTSRAWTPEWTVSREFTGHLSSVMCLAVSQKGNLLAAASANQVRLWNIGTDAQSRPLFKSMPYRWAPALFSFGTNFILQTRLGPALVEAQKGREIRNFGKEAAAFDIFAPDTLLLKVKDSTNPVATWNFRSGAKTNLNLAGFVDHPRQSVKALGSARIVTASTNVYIWEASTGNLLHQFKAIDGRAFGWDLSPDEKFLLVGGQTPTGGCANVISLADHAIKATLATDAVVEAVAFNEAGTLAALGSWDHSVYLCSFPELKLLKRLNGHLGAIYYTAFTRDNALLTASEDGSTVLWDLRSGLEMMRFPFDACFTVNDMWVLGRSGRSGDPMTLEILKAPAFDDTQH
jgi:WD40 repeat protein